MPEIEFLELMRVSKEDVDKIAKLARLRFSESEKEAIRAHLDRILTYAEKLNELDTRSVEPTFSIQQPGDVMREDRVKPSLPKGTVLRNAPDQAHGFFRVPKMIPSSRAHGARSQE
jgi:aspartyl-tRNA(Asn)/glutamyl-tRNA(Gln) amidotransferase subunit C